MSNLETIKKRIQSIEITAKITFAMKMVTTVKLQKYKKNYQIYQNYFGGIMNLFRETINSIEVDLKMINRLLYQYNNVPTTNPKTLYIVIGSDLGMCGHYNNDILKALKQQIDPHQADFYIYGTRIAAMMQSQYPDWTIIQTVGHIDKSLLPELIFIKALELFDFFLKKGYRQINLVYTKFINSLNFNPSFFQVFPIDLAVYNNPDNFMNYAFEEHLSHYELGFKPESMVMGLLPQFFTHMFYAVLLESKISEASARYNAMTAATDNANELLEQYKLEYNRTRQAAITQEIIEIISGSNQSSKKIG